MAVCFVVLVAWLVRVMRLIEPTISTVKLSVAPVRALYDRWWW